MTNRFAVASELLGPMAVVLDVVRQACSAARVDYFIIGAAARDLLLEHVYGVEPVRATGDVDVAVAVESWDEYRGLTEILKRAHGFTQDREPQRMIRGALVLDVVPYGEIADDGLIEWPRGWQQMSVVGFSEVREAAVEIAIDEGAPISVASLPGIGILKLMAWSEAPHRRRQDPLDLCTIMMTYRDAAGDLVYTEHGDLYEDADYDERAASARIYGRDMAPLLGEGEVRRIVLDLLEKNVRDDDRSELTDAMGKSCHHDFAYRLRCLRALLQGIQDRLA